ncbi:hypothetical protein EDD21DRAFT_433387 [Dissophora ornata]|nr:hypothetical protein EDD21DRAFT_433387 [Dissophora ornata]
METSGPTILLFFVIVFFLLAAFILYLFISRCTTPASQRLTLWLKAQSEADQLAETMATQAGCLTEGLRPCRRREKIRKRRAQRQRHLNSRIGGDKEEDMSAAAKGEYSEERTMDEVWRRHQRQRMERPEVDPISASVHSANMAQRVNCSSEGDSMGGAKNDRPLDELAAERLWEFVVGWCLIGCIFAGAALIIGAILRAHNGISGETPWTFDTEDGDSLMDSVVANVMRVALGVRDFGDQLMEHGIFVFVAGINGYVLVRQRVFVRRRLYEGDLSKAGTLPKEYPGKDFTLDVEQQVDAASCERYSGSHREYERAEEGQCNCVEAHPLGDCKFAGGPISMDTSTGANRKESGNIEDHRSLARENINSCQAQCEDDENDSPDFRTMSFLAWFNYLQVGILVIEFLQLFSFPLRELMEFYNQAEKTTAMYESAKTILNVFQAASSSPDRIDFFEPSRLRYHDGTLSLGNNTLFNFNLRNLSYQGDMADSGRAMVTSPLSSPSENTSSALALNPDLDWIRSMPTLDNATALAIPWIKNITASTEWIAETLPAWLPNITTLMTNSSITAAAQGNLEEIRGHLVNAAAEVAIQSLNLTRLSSGNITGALSEAESPKTKQLPKQMAGDSDIVMQIVNSLGLQPSINTRDWYLLRFWSCAFAVLLGWIVALSIHGWNRRCRRLRREGRPHSPAISVGWSVLYLPILSTFLSSAACQSQAIHAYANEQYIQQQEQARREGRGSLQASSIFNSIVLTLMDPSATMTPSASTLLCTGPQIQPSLYLAASLLAYTLAYLLFMVFLTSFERVPSKGEICFRPNGVAVLKNLGLLLAVDFLLIQSPSQRRFRGLVSMAIMLAMACYTIRMKPCYWNKINYWRTFSFSCVLYASLLVALLCPSPEPDKVKGERIGGKWVMAPRLKMGHAWAVGGGPKVMLAWIAAGWVILIIIFVVVDRVFLRRWTKKDAMKKRASHDSHGSEAGARAVPFLRQDRPSAQRGGIATSFSAGDRGSPRHPLESRQDGQREEKEVVQGVSLSAGCIASGSHWSIIDLACDIAGAQRKDQD